MLRKSILCRVLSPLLSFFLVFSIVVVPQTAVYAADSGLGSDQTSSASLSQQDSGLPAFTGAGAVDEPVGYTTNSMMSAIFDSEKSGTSFWMDRMLARPGIDPSTSDSTGNMLSKGRSIWMGWHDPSKLGFVGEVAYIDESESDNGSSKTDGVSGYKIDLTSNGLTENVSKRVSYPSYWTSEYNDSNGLNVNIKKFFTENNVAVSVLNIKNNSATSKSITMTVTSPRATTASGDELTGQYTVPRGLTTVYPRISGDGLTASGSSLTGTFSVAAGQTVSKKVVMGFITNEIPDSTTEYNRFKGYAPDTAFAEQVREYNEWWANNIPYIDVPDKNIKKMIYYRWWLDRFNTQDNELPLNKGFAFPTSVEGVTGYNNAITLPLPWQLEESRYLRNPDLNYGTWLSMGATSGGGAFKDNIGNSAYWTNEYDRSEMKAFAQYITKAGWESYKIFGGQSALLKKFADYGYDDVKDFMFRYDKNNDYIITLPDGSWTGFDSDSPVTKYFNNNSWTGGPVDSLSSAYEFANAQAASEMYSLLGNAEKAGEMGTLADNIKNAVLSNMWDSTKKQFLHKDVNSQNLNPWKDITNFYPFTMGLVPTDVSDYREMFKLWTDPQEFTVWPAYIGNIKDSKAAETSGKSMSYNSAPSSMAVNLSFLAKAVKDYPSSYITADTYKQLLYWGAWGMYVGGNTDYPDANEFWSSVDKSSIGYRSWIHHNMHSKYNVSVIEDVAGFTPRLDNKVELNPIDIGWGHFTVNNLRYHGSDLTIIWNGDNNYSNIPQGYSVYIGGVRMFTVDGLKHLVWDAATGEVTFPEDTATVIYNVSNSNFLTANEVSYSNDRIADMFKKVGLNIAGTDPVTGVSVGQSEMPLYVNQTKKLTAAVEPASAQNLAVKWQSSNSDIATVDEDGNVTGVSEGTAAISAVTEEGGYSAACNVIVSQANVGDLSEIILDKGQMTLSANENGILTAQVQGKFNEITNIAINRKGSGYPAPSASYTCSGDNAWYAVNGDDNPSKRWTSWNSKNVSDWFQIDFGTSKKINRLGLDFYSDGGGVVPPASYKVQYWDGTGFVDVKNMKQIPDTPSSDIENVVLFDTVDTQKIKVVMVNKNPANYGSFVGLNEIGVFYDPYYSQAIKWTSSDTNVATVDQSGNISAIAPGTTTITAKTYDDKHMDECVVTVTSVNKALLAQKIAYTQGFSMESFTEDSWAALQSSLTNAVDVNNSLDATQTAVDTALNSLRIAISGLRYKVDNSVIDFSNNGTGTLDFGGGDQVKRFQTFIARPGYSVISGVDVKILNNNANGDATFELFAADNGGMPAGNALAAVTVPKADINNSISQNNGIVHAALYFDGLTAGQKYAVALGQTTTSDANHDYKWYSSADTSNPDWWKSNVINPQILQDGQNVPSGKFDGSNWVDESRLGDYWLKVYSHAVDKSILTLKISDAQALTSRNYTEESWALLQTVLGTAVNINKKLDSTQAEVDTAVNNLVTAIGSLVKIDLSVIDLSHDGTGDLDIGRGDQVKRFQVFIAREGYSAINGIDVKLRNKNALGDVTVELYSVASNGMPTGIALASSTIPKADVPAEAAIVHADLKYNSLVAGQKYAIALGQNAVTSNEFDYKWYASSDTSNPNWWHSDVINPQVKQDGLDLTSGKYDGSNWYDESRLGDYWLKVYTGIAAPSAPTATPAGGTYSSAQTVSLMSATEGATIYYTVDGSEPTNASIIYTAPIAVTASMVIKAIAVKEGMDNSETAVYSYTINNDSVDKTALESVIQTAGTKVESYYTAESWAVFAAALAEANAVIADTAANQARVNTVRAALEAAMGGLVKAGEPGHEQASAPTATPAGGIYSSAQTVCILSATEGATIYYTVNGSEPTTASAIYVDPIVVNEDKVIKAIAVKEGMDNSEVAVYSYTINIDRVDKTALESVIHEAGTKVKSDYSAESWAVFTPALAEANAAMADTAATQARVDAVRAALEAAMSGLVKAGEPGHEQVPAPTATPAEGKYTSEITVTLACTTEGVIIHYTTDGSTPTVASAIYASPIAVTANTVIKAIAVKEGMKNSEVAAFSYVIYRGSGSTGGSSSSGSTVSETVITVSPDGKAIIKNTPAVVNGAVVSNVIAGDLDKAFQMAVKASDGTKTATIELPGTNNIDKYVLKLPAEKVSLSLAGNNIQLITPAAELNIPSNMFKQNEMKDSKQVEIVIEPLKNMSLGTGIQKLIGNRPLINLYAAIDGKRIEWNNPLAPVEVSIKYSPTEEELRNTDGIVVYYIDVNNNNIPVPNGRYNKETGKVTFTTTHFSNYAVGYVDQKFTDVAETKWYSTAIKALTARGIADGTSLEEFSPDRAITREESIAWLVRALGLNAEINGGFTDTIDSKYSKEIAIAKALGITNGVGDNKFAPKANITRQDLMILIVKALDIANKSLEKGGEADISKFADASKVSKYALESVAALVKGGIVVGSGNNINPKSNITRAEAASIIYKIYNR